MSSNLSTKESATKKYKLLIVDDSKTIISMLTHHFQAHGFEVIANTRSLGTATMIIREIPNIILLDIEMPLLNGAELCKLLKTDPSMSQYAHIPILFYSIIDEEQIKIKVAECGADGYMRKSWPIDKVIKTVYQYLKK